MIIKENVYKSINWCTRLHFIVNLPQIAFENYEMCTNNEFRCFCCWEYQNLIEWEHEIEAKRKVVWNNVQPTTKADKASYFYS